MAKNVSLVQNTEYKGKQGDESPILVAQRYLNLFHQSHIFGESQKNEFNKSLLSMPEKIKEIMPNIPGGRVLLEHLLEVEKENNVENSSTLSLLQRINPEKSLSGLDENLPATANHMAGSVTIGEDFAKNLADSLAEAFKNNNLTPKNNMEELSTVLSKSFDSYANNMQQITQNVLSQNMQQFTEVQNRLQEQFKDIQLSTENAIAQNMQNFSMQQTQNQRFSSGQTNAQMNTQNNNSNSTTINNVNIDSSVFNGLTQTIKESEFQRREDFKQIIEVLNESLALNKKNQEIPIESITNSITEALSNSLAYNSQANRFPIESVTYSITSALRENGKQQIEAIKAFGVTLAQSILKSQKELAESLSKNYNNEKTTETAKTQDISENDDKSSAKGNFIRSVGEKITQTTEKIAKSLSNKTNKSDDDLSDEKNDDSFEKVLDSKSRLKQKDVRAISEMPKEDEKENSIKKIDDIAVEPDNNVVEETKKKKKKKKKKKNKNTEENKDILSQNKENFENEQIDINELLPSNVEDIDLPSEQNTNENIDISDENDITPVNLDENIFSKDTPEDYLSDDKTEDTNNDFIKDFKNQHSGDELLSSFSEEPAEENQQDELLNSFNEESAEENPQDELLNSFNEESAGENPQDKLLNSFDKKDLSSELTENTQISEDAEKTDSINNLESTEDNVFEDIPFEEAFPDLANSSDKDASEQYINSEADHEIDDSRDWEYVDENGNPIDDDSQDWEYVDENGNPIDDNSQDWEYVDENGNPIDDNSQDWEYVDENGNPIDDNSQDWEYVDENGNPIDDNSQDWEYVDENGNPIEEYNPKNKQ